MGPAGRSSRRAACKEESRNPRRFASKTLGLAKRRLLFEANHETCSWHRNSVAVRKSGIPVQRLQTARAFSLFPERRGGGGGGACAWRRRPRNAVMPGRGVTGRILQLWRSNCESTSSGSFPCLHLHTCALSSASHPTCGNRLLPVYAFESLLQAATPCRFTILLKVP